VETIAKYFPKQMSETPGQGANAESAIEQFAAKSRISMR
jgi:hypothetical protein